MRNIFSFYIKIKGFWGFGVLGFYIGAFASRSSAGFGNYRRKQDTHGLAARFSLIGVGGIARKGR